VKDRQVTPLNLSPLAWKIKWDSNKASRWQIGFNWAFKGLIVTEGYLFNKSLIYHQVKLKISGFCPHSVFICFVWTSEQTAIIFLYSINWLVCTTEMKCVYCTVRAESLYTIPRSAHTVYLCVLYGPQNKQRLFPYIALTDWFVQPRWSVFTARYELNLCIQFHVLPTQCIYVFCMDLKTNIDYFPIQH